MNANGLAHVVFAGTITEVSLPGATIAVKPSVTYRVITYMVGMCSLRILHDTRPGRQIGYGFSWDIQSRGSVRND